MLKTAKYISVDLQGSGYVYFLCQFVVRFNTLVVLENSSQ